MTVHLQHRPAHESVPIRQISSICDSRFQPSSGIIWIEFEEWSRRSGRADGILSQSSGTAAEIPHWAVDPHWAWMRVHADGESVPTCLKAVRGSPQSGL